MWNDLPKEWKLTFEESWTAYKNGSIPIGAIITDENGDVIIAGRNRTKEAYMPNKRTAHAEMYCMLNLDIAKFPHLNSYTLYTTMEPCPMCMGTIVMGGIRKVRVAALDSYCGALHYNEFDPYMKGKALDISVLGGEAEGVQLAQQGYFELKHSATANNTVLKKFREHRPDAIKAAELMFESSYLDNCAGRNTPYSEVYNYICNLLK